MRTSAETIVDGFKVLMAQHRTTTAREGLAGLEKCVARNVADAAPDVQDLMRGLIHQLQSVYAATSTED